jgi:hypothetical protein
MTLQQLEEAPISPDYALTGRLYELYQQARRGRQSKSETWRRNYLLSMNRWGRSPDDPRDSEVFPILRQRAAWMTDQEVAFGVEPAAEPFDQFYDYVSNLGEQLETLLNTAYKLNHWFTQVSMVLWDSPIYGAGILKGGWDSGKAKGVGDVTISRVDPWSFYPDPNATNDEDGMYYFEVHKWALDEIVRRFPGVSAERIEAAVREGDRTVTDSSPQKQDFPRYSNDGVPVNLGQGPVSVGSPGQGTSIKNVLESGVNVYECWLHENVEEERDQTDPTLEDPEPVVYDRWRVIVFTGSVILLDETAEDLWDTDRHPYFRFVDDEIGEFWSSPMVSHLAPLQLFINQLLSGAASNVLLTSNPIFMDYENSGLARTAIVNRPGQRLTLKKDLGRDSPKPDWLSPPEMTADIPSLIEFAIGRMENIAGLSGVSKGQQPTGRQAQQTTQAVQEAGFVGVRSSLRQLEVTLAKAGTFITQLIILNYDQPRVVAILGDEGGQTAMRIAAQHFMTPSKNGLKPLDFAMHVSAGSSAPTSRQARVAEIDALAGMEMVDRQTVLQIHRIPHWQAINARMEAAEEAKAKAEAQAKKGPGTGHAH